MKFALMSESVLCERQELVRGPSYVFTFRALDRSDLATERG